MTDRETLQIELLGYWHAGTGRGEGSGADALVARTRGGRGLPYLPGRTLYGLLREAVALAEEIGQLPPKRTKELFGERSEAPNEKPGQGGLGRFASRGDRTLEVTSAFLAPGWPQSDEAQAWEAWAEKHADALAHLTPRLAATAVDERGIARRSSLRSVEVAVPLCLFAEVSAPPEVGDWRADLERALPLLRAAGSRRSRGFGRCQVTFLPREEKR